MLEQIQLLKGPVKVPPDTAAFARFICREERYHNQEDFVVEMTYEVHFRGDSQEPFVLTERSEPVRNPDAGVYLTLAAKLDLALAQAIAELVSGPAKVVIH